MRKPLLCTSAELMQEWCWEDNNQRELDPNSLTIGSGKMAIWLCREGHKYEARICYRSNGSGCPYCSGHRVLEGFNDFASFHPALAQEWSAKNEQLPSQITVHSGLRFWWQCKQGHEWRSTTSDRIAGHGCPYCSGRKSIPGINDLVTLRPDIASEWDYENNGTLSITDIKPGAKRKVWWKCQKGHHWPATVKNRTNGAECPYCAGRLPISGENDLLTVYPSIAKEWNHARNAPVTPNNVLPYSNRKVWWIGVCGHEWEDSINHRTSGRGCPVCNKRNRTSFPEQALYYYIQPFYTDAINGYRGIFDDGMEIDIFIPSLNIGIEYDGVAWHNNEYAYRRELRKYQCCKEWGITLLRVKEKEDTTKEFRVCDILFTVEEGLDRAIEAVLEYLSIMTDVDTVRDRTAIQERYLTSFRESSFQILYPHIASEWHPKKNGILQANMFSEGSSSRVWWLCSRGHEWEDTIYNRTVIGNGCPYCSNHRLLPGYNDLETVAPHIAKEWNYAKNNQGTPTTLRACSTQKVWWICARNHEWQAVIRERVTRNQSCPFCRGKRAWAGFNDFPTTHPELVAEWHTTKNAPLLPQMFTRGSSKKVWWLCSTCSHEWQATISARTSGCACPKCANRRRVNALLLGKQKKHSR